MQPLEKRSVFWKNCFLFKNGRQVKKWPVDRNLNIYTLCACVHVQCANYVGTVDRLYCDRSTGPCKVAHWMCNYIPIVYILIFLKMHDYLRIDFNKFITNIISNNQSTIYSNICSSNDLVLSIAFSYLSEIKTFIKLVTQHSPPFWLMTIYICKSESPPEYVISLFEFLYMYVPANNC